MRTRQLVFVLAGACLFSAAPLFGGTHPASPPAVPMVLPHNPLNDPRPNLPSPVPLAPSLTHGRPTIHPELQRRMEKASGADSVAVIVTLFEPAVPAAAKSDDQDSLRRTYVSAETHDFVTAAVSAGFRPSFALENSPIVVGTVALSRLAELAALPSVMAIEPDRSFRSLRAQGGPLIRSTALRSSYNGTGQGIGVAVIDDGIDTSHPELAGRVSASVDFTGTGTAAGSHATPVAGIIAGNSGGMAPGAHLLNLKAGSAGMISGSSSLDALDWIYTHRAQYGGIHVVNMSFGGDGPYNTYCDDDYPSFDVVLSKLWDVGIGAFASSGNDGWGNGIVAPACLTWTTAVGAVYDANIGPALSSECADFSTAADKITCYSDSGVPLDILAPSDCATTTATGGGYVPCFRGTSAAAPYAAGVAAQLLSLEPATSPLRLRLSLATTGKPITDVNGITRNRIDAVAAYQYLLSNQGTRPNPPSNLVGTITSSTTATISWRDNSDDEDSFVLYYSTNNSTFQAFGSNPANTTSTGITGLVSGTTYYIRVTAKSSAGESSPSNTIMLNTVSTCGACVPGPNTACLLGNRFKVELQIHTTVNNFTGPASVVAYAENVPEIHPTYGPLNEIAYFAAYPWATKKVSLIVSMHNGITINDKFWVTAVPLSDPEYWLTVTDTATCRVWQHYNPLNGFELVRDFNAFPFP